LLPDILSRHQEFASAAFRLARAGLHARRALTAEYQTFLMRRIKLVCRTIHTFTGGSGDRVNNGSMILYRA
jgi:hypothetical protein